MAARNFVLVHHDGTIERVAREEVGEQWLLRVYRGEVTKAFLLGGYACRFCGDDDQEGTLVYHERPVTLYVNEREERLRRAEHASVMAAAMPAIGRAAEGGT